MSYKCVLQTLEFAFVLLIFFEFFCDGLGHHGKGVSLLLLPELVRVEQYVGGLCIARRTRLFNLDLVQLEVVQVVHERLVGPRVMQRRGQVKIAIEQNQQRPLEAQLPAVTHLVIQEQTIAAVPQVFADFFVQFLFKTCK